MEIPYYLRTDLTPEEKKAVGHYRDKGVKQEDWSYKQASGKKCRDCIIFNGILRRSGVWSKLKATEQRKAMEYITQIKSAIAHSRTTRDLELFKGVMYFPKLREYTVGKVVSDNAFGSFTTDINTANKYSGKDKTKTERYIYFRLKLPKGSRALYIDEKEEEYVLLPGMKYYVADKIQYKKAGSKTSMWTAKGNAIVYYLEIA